MARIFSQKHSSTSVGNVGIYSVGTESVYQKWQSSKTKCVVSVLWEGLTCEILVKTSCLHPVLTFRIPIMCRAHASLCRKLTHELSAKTLQSSICPESSHSFSYIQPLQWNPTNNTGYIRLNIITIKFGTE